MGLSGYDGTIKINTKIDSKEFNTGMSKITSSLKGVAAAVGVAFGIKQLIAFGKEAVNLASDLAEVQNVVDVAFGEMTYKMEAFASSSIENFGMSELAAKKTGSSFMAMAKGMNFVTAGASDMAIELTGLSADMASFYNINQDEARVALSSVFTGETETLKRYGILLTEVNLQEYARQQGISKSINKMTQQEKVMLRYKYVLDATKLAQGDFIRTQDSWANQTRILSERWKQFLSLMGQGLIQLLTPALKFLNTVMEKLIKFAQVFSAITAKLFGKQTKTVSAAASSTESAAEATDDYDEASKKASKSQNGFLAGLDEISVLDDKSESNSNSITDALGGSDSTGSTAPVEIGDNVELSPKLQEVTDKISTFFGKMKKWLSENKGYVELFVAAVLTIIGAFIALKVITSIINGVGSAITLLTSPIGLVVLAIAALIAIVILCVKHWDEIKEFAINAVNIIRDKFVQFGEWFEKKGEQIGEWCKTKVEAVSGFFERLGEGIEGSLVKAFAFVKTSLKNYVNGWISIVERFLNFFIKGINSLISAVNRVHFTVPDWVPAIGGKTLGFNIGQISQVSIPRLATGAVIPPNAEFAAILGDQRHGRNLEAPEGLIRQIVKEESGASLSIIIQMPDGSQKEVFSTKNINKANRQAGKIIIPVEG